MAEKTLNTRILLKYDSLANWQTKNTLLKQGEVAFVQIGEISTDNNGNRVIPPVMFKVGPGNFNDLGWGSATAADVYAWAKAEHLALNVTEADAVNDGKYVNGLAWDSTTHTLKPQMVSFDSVIDDSTKDSTNAPTTKAVKDYVDTEVQKAVSGGVEGLATEDYVDTAIENLSKDGGAIKAVVDGLAAHEQAFAEFQEANTQAIADAVAAEALIARAAEEANAAAITAIKDDANIDSFADVVAELAKKQDTIPANTYDAYGSASTAEQNAKNYADQIKSDLLGTEELEGTYDTLKEIGAWIATSGVDATELADAIAVESKAREDGDKAINDTLATYGDIVTHDASEFQIAGNYETAGAAAQALADAKADTKAQIEALKLGETYEPIGAEARAKAYADGLADNYDTAGSAEGALTAAKAYTDELANGTVKTNSDKIAALEALDFILNGDTVILDCGGAE